MVGSFIPILLLLRIIGVVCSYIVWATMNPSLEFHFGHHDQIIWLGKGTFDKRRGILYLEDFLRLLEYM